MKKFIVFFAMTAAMLIVFATSTFAIEWVFDNETAIKAWKYDGMNASYTDKCLYLTMTADDVYMTYTLKEDEQFEAAENPFVAIRMKVESKVDYGGFFFGTSKYPGPQGDEYSNFEIKPDGKWHEYVFNMSSYPHKRWSGILNKFRIDIINAADLDAKITIERIGIFKTEDEAIKFNKANVKPEEVKLTDMTSPTWIFDSLESIQKWNVAGAESVYRFGYLCLVPTTWDPTLTYNFSEEEQFYSSEFKFFAFRLKPRSVFNAGVLFFSNDTYNGFSDESHIAYLLKNEQWNDVIINMSENFPERWAGKVDKIRLDPINGGTYDANAEIYLDRCGFFRTEAEAKEFLANGRDSLDYSLESTINKEMCKTIIPAGTINGEYKEEEYVIQGAVDVKGKNDAVVICVGKNGNETIVPLSYVNGAGYATYVANKPGTYKVGYNTKNFIDTKNHWADEYISFVADRKLFGGTSEDEFSPDMTMTRGMFVTALGRMHGLDISKYDGNTAYNDVNLGEYYAPYIQWAKELSLAAPESATSFAPEESITRKDMAIIISNYMKTFNYKFKLLDEVEEFVDLASFSEEEKTAIKSIQKAGIINGKGDNKFDPDGISTRAEVATVMQRVIKAVLNVNMLYSNYTNDYITRDRIRIGVWSYYVPFYQNDYFKTLAEAGFDTVNSMQVPGGNERDYLFDMADKYGIEMLVGSISAREGETANPITMNAAIYEHPSFGGSYLTDEPGTDQFPWISKLANDYIEKMPGKIPFINLLPMYANAAQLKYDASAAAIEYYDTDPNLYRNYCEEYCKQFDTSYICVDIYPLNWSNKLKTTYKDYVESINQVASVAREYNKEFWCCLQANSWDAGKRTPELNEYMWQCYTLLSFGCKGILWWYYEGTLQYPSLIDRNTMKPTQAYYDSQTTIKEIKAISDTFIQYKNLGAFTHNYTSAVPYLRMTNEYKNFNIISEVKCDDPLLIGCFEKLDGKGYAFTIVNMTELQAAKTVTVKVKLSKDATVTSYQGGTPKVIKPTDGYYTVQLEWGLGTFITVE